jgi:ABC-type branched-subunit amino acid transport system substrate-binding protein
MDMKSAFVSVCLVVLASPALAQSKPNILVGIEGETKAFSNEEENTGFKLAFREINDAAGINGRQIEWRGYDRDITSNDAGVANARRLTETDGVVALINMGGPLAVPLAKYAEEAHVPYLFPHTALIDSAGKRYVFTSYPGYGGEAKVMFKYLPQQRGMKRLAIVRDENVYGQFFYDRLKEYAEADGYEVVGDAVVHSRQPASLKDELDTVIQSNPDGVVMALYPAQAKVLMAAKSALNWKGRMISSGPLTDEQFLNMPDGSAEGTLGFCYYPDPEKSAEPGVARYRDAMQKYEAGRPLNRYTLYGYTFGRLVAEGMRRAGAALDRERLVDAMETISDWSSGGVMPPVTLSKANHHAQVAGFICELKDRRFAPLSNWIAPQD